MSNLTDAMILAGALALILGVIPAIRTLQSNRRGKSAPFRDYFGPEYDRDLRHQSDFSETDDWLSDRHARFAPFRLRDRGSR